jgi:hypothetical protein
MRILSVFRSSANKVDGLRGLSDSDLLDRWFVEFSRLRSEMQRASREADKRAQVIHPGRGPQGDKLHFCRDRPASQGRSAGAHNGIQDLTRRASLDGPQVCLSQLRGRYAGVGIHLHRDERLANPTGSDSIDAQTTRKL